MATQVGHIKRINHFKGINVDGFQFQTPDVKAYVLTHFHSDHTIGLTSSFKGPQKIYCSKITGNLIREITKVKEQFVVQCELHEETDIEGTSFTVTFFDANHCPGAVMAYFFDKETKKTVLHTGDFRADEEKVQKNKALLETLKRNGRVDELYLDTTYCNPNYDFPSQKVALQCMQKIVLEALKEEPKTLFTCSAYSVGKEKAFKAIGEAVHRFFNNEKSQNNNVNDKTKIAVMLKKKQMLTLTEWYDEDCFTCFEGEPDDPTGSKAMEQHVRVISHGGKDPHVSMNAILLAEKHRFKRVIAFSPSGWAWKWQMRKTYEETKCLVCEPWEGNDGSTKLYHVPYSEHSSYGELLGFVEKVRPRKITPTVNADTEKDRDKLLKRFEQWLDLSANKGKLHHYFSKSKTKNNTTNNNNNNTNKSDDTIICLSSDDEDDVEIIDPLIRAALGNVKIDIRTQQSELERLTCSKVEKKGIKQENNGGEEKKEHIIIDLSRDSNSPVKGINKHSSREVLEPFPLGCVCVVRNGEFKQFKNRNHVEQRLRELGAEVVNRKSSRVTHIMCAHGSMQATELLRLEKLNYNKGTTTPARTSSAVTVVAAAAEASKKSTEKKKSQDEEEEEEEEEENEEHMEDAITVTESWLMRHVRAMKNGTAREHTSEEIELFHERQRKRLKLARAEKEKKKKKKQK